MKTKESDNKKESYKSPSARMVGVSVECMICISGDCAGTEGYGLNGQSLSDDDFE